MTDLMVSVKYEKRTNVSCAWMHVHATDIREATERGRAVGPCPRSKHIHPSSVLVLQSMWKPHWQFYRELTKNCLKAWPQASTNTIWRSCTVVRSTALVCRYPYSWSLLACWVTVDLESIVCFACLPPNVANL